MGLKKKTPKGEISISDNNGRIRLRWRYAGERYSLNLPYAFLPEYMHHASLKIAEIKLDIAKGDFDTTLRKYNPSPLPIKHSTEEKLSPAPVSKVFLDELVFQFDNWAKNIRNVDVDNTTYYLLVRRLLLKWKKIPIAITAQKLNAERLAASTYNDRLSVLSAFFIWLVGLGEIMRNPLQDVRRKRNKNKGRAKNPRRLPLTEDQIEALLKAIKEDTYCPSASNFKHSFYHPFLLFLFSTGVRNAEAIGLRVKHVDLVNKRVEISESFARTIKGTNHAARIQKGTKTENSRWLYLSDEILELLRKQIQGKQSNDFVFTSPKGVSIDDRMLKRRILKPVLIMLEFGDRDLYAARHSFGTRLVEQGHSLTDIAYWMGHSTIETAVRNYVTISPVMASVPVLGAKNKQMKGKKRK